MSGDPELERRLRETWPRFMATADAREVLETLAPHFRVALDRVENPERVYAFLDRLFAAPGSVHMMETLARQPQFVERLITLIAASEFLSEILLRHPDSITSLSQGEGDRYLGSVSHLHAHFRRLIAEERTWEGGMDVLRREQRRLLLHIGACDLWGCWDLSRVTRALSVLAEAAVRAALDLAAERTGIAPTDFVVLALGKLGGRELNYSSDIDLLFLARDDASRYVPLAERLIDVLTRVTAEGFLYRVDMRLRPWGRSGPLVISVEGYRRYLDRHARQWEHQALLKARAVAGNRSLGAAFLRSYLPHMLTQVPADVHVHVRAVKADIERALRRRGRTWGEVKLGEGSIRDIEFLVQYLQLRHGRRHPGVLTTHTRRALHRLYKRGLLPPEDFRVLDEGYTFLRTVEHYLQLVHYRQVHRLPETPTALAQLAHRLGYEGDRAAEEFLRRYEQHRQAIRRVYERYLHPEEALPTSSEVPSPVAVHTARMGPDYRRTFDPETQAHHALLASRLTPEHPVEVEARLLDDGAWEVTIVAFDYLGELSLITGLLFVYGLNIVEGTVFTYRDRDEKAPRKIVDVFVVRPTREPVDSHTWDAYRRDLAELLRLLAQGRQAEAQGRLLRRFAHALPQYPEVAEIIHPVDITLDNETSEHYTLLRIEAPDTVGFLYEFTNALALQGIYIAQVTVATVGDRVQDVLWVTDAKGRKILDPQKQQELRVATVLVKQFTHLIPRAPDPEAALVHFRQFLADLFTRPQWPRELVTLQNPTVLHALARLLGASDFLWDDFLRVQYEQLFPILRDVEVLHRPKNKVTLWFDLQSALENAPPGEERTRVLNAFKDREMFRVDMRYILGLTDIDEFAAELSDVAEVVIEEALHLAYRRAVERYGRPMLASGRECPLAVCGLGKLGGREMGFASDVELMFVYDGPGQTTGPRVIGNAEFFEHVVEVFLDTVRSQREGIFEVDLQLRPYGKAGSLAVSRRAFEEYFRSGGPAWPYERQALVRLRAIAGDEAFGREVEALRDRLVYTGEPFDVTAMRAMRERQLRHLVSGGTLNAKFSPGGLVDVEYLVQGLQITYGFPYPELRTPNTAKAMRRLAEKGILAANDYRRLRAAHRFLRELIEALRVVRGNARDLTVPPPTTDAGVFLARRMGYGHRSQDLWNDLLAHMTFVQDLVERML